MKSGIFMNSKTDKLRRVTAGLAALPKRDVLVGIPSEGNARNDDSPLGNAAIYYIQENGAPEANIPARPTLSPGVMAVKDQIANRFRQVGQAVLEGKMDVATKALHAAGLVATSSIKKKIGSNVQPALAASTLAARRRRGVTRESTLIDTGSMQNHVTYIVREK